VQERVAHQFEAGDVLGAVAAVLAGGVVGGADAVATVPSAQGGGCDAEFARHCRNAQLRHVGGGHFASVRAGRGGRRRDEDARSGVPGLGTAHLIVGSPGDRGNSAL